MRVPTPQFPRGSKRANDQYTGPEGSVSIDTDRIALRLHDGETQGGRVLTPMADSPQTDGYFARRYGRWVNIPFITPPAHPGEYLSTTDGWVLVSDSTYGAETEARIANLTTTQTAHADQLAGLSQQASTAKTTNDNQDQTLTDLNERLESVELLTETAGLTAWATEWFNSDTLQNKTMNFDNDFMIEDIYLEIGNVDIGPVREYRTANFDEPTLGCSIARGNAYAVILNANGLYSLKKDEITTTNNQFALVPNSLPSDFEVNLLNTTSSAKVGLTAENLCAVAGKRELKLLNLEFNTLVGTITTTFNIQDFCWISDSRVVVVGFNIGEVAVYNGLNGDSMEVSVPAIGSIAESNLNGDYIHTRVDKGDGEKHSVILEVDTWTELYHMGPDVRQVEWSEDDTIIGFISGGLVGFVKTSNWRTILTDWAPNATTICRGRGAKGFLVADGPAYTGLSYIDFADRNEMPLQWEHYPMYHTYPRMMSGNGDEVVMPTSSNQSTSLGNRGKIVRLWSYEGSDNTLSFEFSDEITERRFINVEWMAANSAVKSETMRGVLPIRRDRLEYTYRGVPPHLTVGPVRIVVKGYYPD